MSILDVSKPDPDAADITTDPTADTARELDRRHSDGIDVRLLWHPHTDRIVIALEDDRLGHNLELDVDGTDALDASVHPYAYAASVDARDARGHHPIKENR